MSETEIVYLDPPPVTAFPSVDPWGNFYSGLTKRELFAAMTMQGLMTMPPADAFISVDDLAEEAVSAADALLSALNESGEGK